MAAIFMFYFWIGKGYSRRVKKKQPILWFSGIFISAYEMNDVISQHTNKY